MRASIYLVEIGAFTGSETITLRYASEGFTTRPVDNPANVTYAARLVSAGKIEQHMFDRGRTTGAAYLGLGEVTLGNTDGALDALRNYSFDGRPVRMLRLDGPNSSYGSAEVVYVATAEAMDWSNGDAPRLRFYDRRRLLDKPLLTSRYAGTTTAGGQNTAEGTPEQQGQLKPHIWGRVLNIEPTIANPFDVILQFSDGPINAVTLYDGGIQLDYDGSNTSLAALIPAQQNPGHYRAWLNGGMVRPGGSRRGQAGFVWTADVSEGAAAAQRTAGQVVLRMLAHMGYTGSAVDLVAFNALDVLTPAEVGIFVDTEDSAASIIRQVLDSVGAYLTIDVQGRFTVGRFVGVGTPLGTIRDHDIVGETFGAQANVDTDGGLPAREVRLQWGRNWRPLNPTEIAADVSDNNPARTEAIQQEWREIVRTNAAISARHPLATEMVFVTALVNKADAEAETTRRNTLYGTPREVVEVTVSRERAVPMLLNTSWTVQVDRIGFAAGKAMVIIGREVDLDAETVTLTLWG
jgi:hypothetical protein